MTMRSVLRVSERLLLGFGGVVLLYSLATLAYAEMVQRDRSRQFEQQIVLAAVPAVTGGGRVQGLDRSVGVDLQYANSPRVEVQRGDTVGKLEIPGLGISLVVLHGVETETLDVAGGHLPGTPLPGGNGNAAIAAHRDTFFRNLKDIQIGDVVTFSNWRGTFTYEVESNEIVSPEDTRVLESNAREELTLITCYPFYFVGSAPERFVVHARLLSSVGAGQ